MQILHLPHSSSHHFLCSSVAVWQDVPPNACCNPSAWQAHLFHVIFLRCSLSLGDQHCSISCSSAPARRSGELFYLHIRKNRWKMALCAFHSAFSLKLLLICWAFPSQTIVFSRKILSLLNEPFHKIEKGNVARLWSCPAPVGRKWLWCSYTGERDTFCTSLGAVDPFGEPKTIPVCLFLGGADSTQLFSTRSELGKLLTYSCLVRGM